MNSWGLPDWQNESSYGDTSNWGPLEWRWEFHRRRQDLRKYFDERAERSYQTAREVSLAVNDTDRDLAPSEPGFLVPADDTLFGYSGIPNPRISEHPRSLLLMISMTASYVGFYDGEHYSETGIALEGDNQAAVVFDLDRPLGPQIVHAKQKLKSYQVGRHGKTMRPKLHRSKWLTYLRVLDAQECGASWSEISSILPHTAQTPQTARDVRKQARALCFKFPF